MYADGNRVSLYMIVRVHLWRSVYARVQRGRSDAPRMHLLAQRTTARRGGKSPRGGKVDIVRNQKNPRLKEQHLGR